LRLLLAPSDALAVCIADWAEDLRGLEDRIPIEVHVARRGYSGLWPANYRHRKPGARRRGVASSVCVPRVFGEQSDERALPSARIPNKRYDARVEDRDRAILLAMLTDGLAKTRELLKAQRPSVRPIHCKPERGLVALVKLLPVIVRKTSLQYVAEEDAWAAMSISL